MTKPNAEVVYGFNDDTLVDVSVEGGFVFLESSTRLGELEAAVLGALEARRLARKLYEFARYLESKGR